MCIQHALGWLNLEQVGRLGLLGVADLLVVSAWTTRRHPETRIGKACVVATWFIFMVFVGYHGFLREYFGMQADDETVIAAFFSSSPSESVEFLEQNARGLLKHLAFVLAATGLFGFLIHRWPLARRRDDPGPTPRQGWITLGACLAVFVGVHLNRTMRNMDPLLYFPTRYQTWKRGVESVARLQSEMAAAASDPGLETLRRTDENPRTVVLMLSESITRLNFPNAGYPRNTAPELGALGGELIWFSDVRSPDPSTVPVLCKMLTPATIAEPDLWRSRPDLLLMARKAGYKTFWLSNHTTDDNGTVAIFVSHADRVVLANRGSSRGEGSYDEILLPLLEQALQDPSLHKFVVVHLLGAHPAYYYRYPKEFARFNGADDAVTRGLKAAGRARWAIAMRNCYDNALLYSDHVLKRSIDLCRASGQPVAWLFVPDHGQDAAHYSNFLGHNARVPSQYEIPAVLWRSAAFPPLAVEPSQLASRPYQTDLLDHALLGLMGIAGDYYEASKDLLSAEFEPAPGKVLDPMMDHLNAGGAATRLPGPPAGRTLQTRF
jgi:heptose-I-phosphate ethanolaminephosphotransferase